MSLHRDRYLAGSAYYLGTIYRPGGRQIRVFDRTLRWKLAARCMMRAGRTELEIAMFLNKPRAAVRRVLAFNWKFF